MDTKPGQNIEEQGFLIVSPLGRAVPGRLGYPDNEAFNNAANYQSAITSQFGGSNSQNGKVWWDKP